MTLNYQTPGMKWLLYASALLFALLSCKDQSTGKTQGNDTISNTANSSPVHSQTDSLNTGIDNSGTSMGEGTTTSGTSTGSSSTHKDSVKKN
jgi:hypothetical protein